MLIEKKKLFLIINRLVLGGQSIDAISLANRLSATYEVTILYGEKEADELETSFYIQQYPVLTFIKLNTLRRAILPLKDISALKQLYKIIKKAQPQIVHTHGFKSGLLGRLAAWKANVPVVIHTYHGHLFHSYYNRFISSFICFTERILAKISTRIIAISPHQAYELTDVYRIAPPAKISVVCIGIDEKKYALQSATGLPFRQRYNVPAHTTIVAIIGRLVTIKNHSFFINVIKRLQFQKADVRFFIIGDGYSKATMQQEMNEKGIQWQEGIITVKTAGVIFTSWITNIAEALEGVDIVALTSFNEGTPVSLIEAQLFEKAVISTNVGGVRDTMLDGETGFLVNNFNLDDYVNKLQLLIDDKTLRASMGSKGKIFVQTRFSKDKEAAAISELYTTCLQLKGIN